MSITLATTSQAQVFTPAPQQAVQAISLPNSAAAPPLNLPQHGLRMDVDGGWADAQAYVPVKFSISRTAPSTSDTTVSLHLQSYDGYRNYGPFGGGEYGGTHVWEDVEIPAGVMQVEATLALLQIDSRGYSWEVFVDGELAEELAGSQTGYYGGYGYGYSNSNASPANILLVASPANSQTIADLAISMSPGLSQQQIDDILDRAKNNSWQRSTIVEGGMRHLVPAAFPRRPIDYNSVDVIYVNLDDLQQLAREKDVWRAVKAWIASGGNLWVVGVGDHWQRLGEVEKLLGLPAAPGNPRDRDWFSFGSDREKEIASNAWNSLELDREARAAALLAPQTNQNPTGSPPAVATSTVTAGQTMQIPPPHALWHGYMLGQIGVFAAERPFAEDPALGGPGMALTHRFPLDALLGWREEWLSRHGISLGNANIGFWNWLVPGVGLAPVTMFQVLITLFVLAIGPLNFFLLRRWKRLYFLLVTVPLAAGLITLGLFAYAFLTDGLSTRVRVRSFTEIDPTTNLAATWARLSYYSALAPADGLRFPTDTILLPIESEERYSYYRSSRQVFLEVHWGREAQYLKGDWLPSRTPVQYTMIRARQTPLKLKLDTTQQGVRVQNLLQSNIVQLLVCGEDGKFYWADRVDQGAAATLDAIEFSRAKPQLVATLREAAPAYPPGWVSSTYGHYHVLGEWRETGKTITTSSDVENSLLEVALERIIATDPASPDSIYGPGRFIAIVDRSPEVPLGLEDIEEQASVHVITGRWK